MARIEHTTIEGETVAEIAERYFGDVSPYLGIVYEQNPKLSTYGKILPAGLKVFLDVAVTEEKVIDKRRDLWLTE